MVFRYPASGSYTFDSWNGSDADQFLYTGPGTPQQTLPNNSGTARYWCWDNNKTPSGASNPIGPLSGAGGNPDGYLYTEASYAGTGDFVMEFDTTLDASVHDIILEFKTNQRGGGNYAICVVETNENGAGWVERGTRFGYINDGDRRTSTTDKWVQRRVNLAGLISHSSTRVRIKVIMPSGNAGWNDYGIDEVAIIGEPLGSTTDIRHYPGTPVSGQSSGATGLAVPWPSTEDGDLIVMVGMRYSTDFSGPSFTTPSGWTFLSAVSAQYYGGYDVGVFYKFADGTESGTLSLYHANTLSYPWSAVMVACRNVDQTTPFDVTPTSSHSVQFTGSTIPTFPSITTVTNNAALLLIHANAGYSSYMTSTPFLGAADRIVNHTGISQSNREIFVMTKDVVTAEAATPGQPYYTAYAPHDLRGRAITLALRPAPPVTIVSVGTATESETANTAIPVKAAALSTATETETSHPVDALKPITAAIGAASETESSRPVAGVKPVVVSIGATAETELSQPASAVKPIAALVGATTESETPQTISADKPIIVQIGVVSETETTEQITASKPIIVSVAAGSESETSHPVAALKPIMADVGATSETETPQPVSVHKPAVVSVAGSTETESSEPVSPVTVVPVGLVAEAESALSVDAVKMSGVTVTEGVGVTDQRITVTKATTINEPVGIVDAVSGSTRNTSTEPVGVSDTVSRAHTVVRTATEAIGVSDTAAVGKTDRETAADTVGVTDSVSCLLITHISIEDSVGVEDTVESPSSISEPVGVTDDVSVEASTAFTDQVGVTDTTTPSKAISVSIMELVGVEDVEADLIRSAKASNDPVDVEDETSRVLELKRQIQEAVTTRDAVLTKTSHTITDLVDVTDSRREPITGLRMRASSKTGTVAVQSVVEEWVVASVENETDIDSKTYPEDQTSAAKMVSIGSTVEGSL